MKTQGMTANQRALQALIDEKPAKKTPYQKLTAKAARERWEDVLAEQMTHKRCLPPIERQGLWHPRRRYVADFICRPLKLIIECDGGLHVKDG